MDAIIKDIRFQINHEKGVLEFSKHESGKLRITIAKRWNFGRYATLQLSTKQHTRLRKFFTDDTALAEKEGEK